MYNISIQFYKNGKTDITHGETLTLTSRVGSTGATGEGAYELAVAAGYAGTKASFITALSEIGSVEELLSKI